ncbi:26s proteasome non-atpase regulatory subunit 6 like protein [Quercus suber]|uniref:O-fucosyltransferase family protein n=1 Tax=Quercus suber TaxID=58331 RepID=A0AAW0LJK1_QUESU
MFLRRRESSESNWVGRGTEPCLDFSIGYRKPSPKISKEKRRFLVVVASGGLNQHRNQIVDAVVIARILEAALVVPVLQKLDVKHFKWTLQADVSVVLSLPSTHLMSRQTIENKIPYELAVNLVDERGIADAELNLGETEVREAHLAKATYFIQIGDKHCDLCLLTVEFDIQLPLLTYHEPRRKHWNNSSLFEEGGDWERKNRLKKAASLFLDSISTSTTYELFPYDTFIFYTVLISIITLDRVSLKQKLLTIIEKIPYLSDFLNSLYECQYKSFFEAFGKLRSNVAHNLIHINKMLREISSFGFSAWSDFLQHSVLLGVCLCAGLMEQIKLDRYLHPHFCYYMREVSTVVYSQFLESYKSVTIEAMTKAFGVTVKFIDLELSHFIATGKLHCKIDKVAGVLETNRPDAKNVLYQATIKQGDFPLNRIQKLSRVLD